MRKGTGRQEPGIREKNEKVKNERIVGRENVGFCFCLVPGPWCLVPWF